MAEQDQPQQEQAPIASVGTQLRLAREAAGLNRADVSARTKIAERHLATIESGNFAGLASATYAVGFSRAYARAVGLDEAEVAKAVRAEMGAVDETNERPLVQTFEPGDPARVPASGIAWAAALGAILVIGAVFFFWRSYYSPAVSLPDLIAPKAPQAATSVAPVRAAPAAPAAQGSVVFTALDERVWVKIYDASGKQLLQKEMARGESFTLPPDAAGPLIRTARPDALAITIGGRPVPRLAERQTSIADVPVSAAALLARTLPAGAAPAQAPTQAVAAAAVPAPRPSMAAPAPRPASPASRSTAAPPRPRPTQAPAPIPTPVPQPTPAAPAPTPTPDAASTVSE